MGKYRFKDTAPFVTYNKQKLMANGAVILVPVTERGVYPFGELGCVVTDENLDEFAEYFLGKDDYAAFIEVAETKKEDKQKSK